MLSNYSYRPYSTCNAGGGPCSLGELSVEHLVHLGKHLILGATAEDLCVRGGGESVAWVVSKAARWIAHTVIERLANSGRSRQVLSSVLAKEVALSVQHGVHDSLSYQSSFTNFQRGVGMDAVDDLIASALAGGSVTPLV